MNEENLQNIKPSLQGMVIRDEFRCPILSQLFRDPVIAQDGHTYERISIERWFEQHSTSPRTGNILVIHFSSHFEVFVDFFELIDIENFNSKPKSSKIDSRFN